MIVTGRDFRARQATYIGYAQQGEDVIVKTRAGSVRLIPVVLDSRIRPTANSLGTYEEAMTMVENVEQKARLRGEKSPGKVIEEAVLQGKDISVEELFHVLVCDIKGIYEGG